MRAIDTVIDSYKDSGSNEIESAYTYNQVEEMMHEYGEGVAQECIDIIAKHCQESKEMGMIASPDVMVMLLEKLKDELK